MNRNVPNPLARFRAKQTAPLVVPAVPTFAGGGAAAPAAGRRPQRSKRFWIAISLGAVVALLMSNCAGYVAGGSAFESQQTAIAEELSAALAAQEQAETRVVDLEREVSELEPKAGEAETLLASLEDERATIVTLQQERDAAVAAVAALESRIAALEADAAAAPAAPAAQPQPAARPAPAAQPAPAASAYYENCSAARAAGVAPLRDGVPGYRSALDRDGDGVACES